MVVVYSKEIKWVTLQFKENVAHFHYARNVILCLSLLIVLVVYVIFSHSSTCNRVKLIIKWHFGRNFVINIHHFAHKTNLVVITLLYLFLMHQLKVLYITYILFLFTTQKNKQNFKSWLISSTLKVTSCSRMWKTNGSHMFCSRKIKC